MCVCVCVRERERERAEREMDGRREGGREKEGTMLLSTPGWSPDEDDG